MKHRWDRQLRTTLLGISLLGILCLVSCKDKTDVSEISTIDYAIEKPAYKGPMRVVIRLSHENIKLSDFLEMELSVTIEPDYTVQYPQISETLKQFKIRHWDQLPQTFTEDGKIVKTRHYQLEPLELGMCEIPAFEFTFEATKDSEGVTTEGTLATEPLWIDVATMIPADPDAFVLTDIEDVVTVKADYTWLWMTLGLVCVLAGGIAVGMALKPKKVTQQQRIYKPAHEIALEVLKAIAREKLVEQGRIKEFYEKLSGCLRQYIENRFQLRAPEQTTEEFLEQLKTSDALELEHKQQLQKFLEHCDLVKFARYQPSDEQINESLTMAEEFVDKTKSQERLVDVTEVPEEERQVTS